MFSGIVEAVGTVTAVEPRQGGVRLSIQAGRLWPELKEGSSLSVSGVCLTVTSKADGGVVFLDVVPETIARTTLSDLKNRSRVNLEMSLRLDDRLGGHLVSGHIDGVGAIVEIKPEGDGKRMIIRPPAELNKYIVYKGSVAVAGVSLTVAAAGSDVFEVALIPYTLENTTLGENMPGDRVNLEADMVAKYVERLLGARSET